MRIGDMLAELSRAPVVGFDQLVGPGGLVVLAPHPDDETLGCGGIIAEACRAERHVEVVFLTDGSASHRGSRSWSPRRIAELREAEALAAAAVLGVPAAHVTFLGQPDAAAPQGGPVFSAGVDTLDQVMTRAGATTLLVTWEHDPHCDHETAELVARTLARRKPGVRVLRYPIWGLHRPPDDVVEQVPWRGFRVDVAQWLDVKREALDCHASQLGKVIDDDPDGFSLNEATVAPLLARYEHFIGDKL